MAKNRKVANREGEAADRLEEIADELRGLYGRAREAVCGTSEEMSAEAYWLAQLRILIDNDHGFLGGAGVSIADTIASLRVTADEGDDEVGA